MQDHYCPYMSLMADIWAICHSYMGLMVHVKGQMAPTGALWPPYESLWLYIYEVIQVLQGPYGPLMSLVDHILAIGFLQEPYVWLHIWTL
jgi:hypothetical protein